jgi:hypothetical protein
LGDALHYAHSFNPHTIIDIATLTGAIVVALGSLPYGILFCFAFAFRFTYLFENLLILFDAFFCTT